MWSCEFLRDHGEASASFGIRLRVCRFCHTETTSCYCWQRRTHTSMYVCIRKERGQTGRGRDIIVFWNGRTRHIINFCCFVCTSPSSSSFFFRPGRDRDAGGRCTCNYDGGGGFSGEKSAMTTRRRKQPAHGHPLISLYLAVGTNKKSYSSPARERNLLLARASRGMLTFILKKSLY